MAAGRLVFRESADPEADTYRLAALFQLINEFPGHEPLSLRIVTKAGESIDLALPTVALDFQHIFPRLRALHAQRQEEAT